MLKEPCIKQLNAHSVACGINLRGMSAGTKQARCYGNSNTQNITKLGYSDEQDTILFTFQSRDYNNFRSVPLSGHVCFVLKEKKQQIETKES